jgi:multiple sugar transport system substrate-binding protein
MTMKKVKNVMNVTLSCVMFLALLAGCSKSSGSGQGASAAKVDLTWWQTSSGPAEYYQPAARALVDKFNETNSKNINVTIEFIGDNNYEMMLTAVSSGNAPDAAVGWSPQPMQYGLIGEGLPLNSIYNEWKAEGNPIIDDILKEYWDFYTAPDGNLYGIPYRYDPRVITYRKDMFQQAGIAKMPVTWDEFIDVCRQLKRTFPDKVPFIVAGGSFMGIHACIGFGANNGTGWVSGDLKPNMTSKEWIEMLEFFGKLRQEGLISAGSAAYLNSDIQKMFTAGEGAMIYEGTPTFIRDTDLENKCGIMPPLRGPSGSRQQTYAWITGSHALKQTKHPDETRAWLKWWSENTLSLFTEGRNISMPIRKSHQANPIITSDWMRAAMLDCSAIGCVTNSYPVSNLYLEFAQIEGEGIPANALRRVMEGDTNYAGIAATWNERLAAVFK